MLLSPYTNIQRVRLYAALAWQLVLHNKVLGLHYFCTWFPIGEYVVCIWLILGLTLAILGLPAVCSWCRFPKSFLSFYFSKPWGNIVLMMRSDHVIGQRIMTGNTLGQALTSLPKKFNCSRQIKMSPQARSEGTKSPSSHIVARIEIAIHFVEDIRA